MVSKPEYKIGEFKKEELSNSEIPFDCESEVWSGMKIFMEWLECKNNKKL